jgi:tetratricopeptide (TPR) repeat protein
LVSWATAGMVTAFIVLAAGIGVFWRRYKECVFFLLWHIIFYLPVCMIPLSTNPMASRYMYLPMVGLVIVSAVFLYKAFNSDLLKKYSPYLSKMLYAAVVMICVTRTLLLNNDCKDNFSLGWVWVRDYPLAHRGYTVLGAEYFNAGNFEKARGYFEKSVRLGGLLPRELMTLAGCYMHLGEIDAAEALLKKIMVYYPDYDLPFIYLGEIYYNQKNYSQAQALLEKALILNPNQPLGYTFLMKVYLNLHNVTAAKDLLNKAGLRLSARDVSALRHD